MLMGRLESVQGPRRRRIYKLVRALTSEEYSVDLEEEAAPSAEGQQSFFGGPLHGMDHISTGVLAKVAGR
jgi:hypothetical protein